ncbi:MAG: hypothetical protein U0Y68_23570 [Blastocatellia bacterium]
MKKHRELTPAGFDCLLAWLDPDRETAGTRYLKICERLTRLFMSRGCHEAEELTFETIRRVAQKSPAWFADYQGEPLAYFFAVAHNVHLEWLAQQPEWDSLPPSLPAPASSHDETPLDYLEHCLQQLAAPDRETLLRYYQGSGQPRIEARKKLGTALGLSENALRIRLSRLRQTVADCLKTCLKQK